MRVAIFGAGVAGLAAAKTLVRAGHEAVVYARSGPGGLCQTAELMPTGDPGRWADLGVSDFNRSSYLHVGRELDELGVAYRPIDTSACFFSRDGALSFTTDGEHGTAMPKGLERELLRLQQDGLRTLVDPKLRDASLAELLAGYRYSSELAEVYLYPRVNAMFCCDERDIPGMPARAVMHFYILQEGCRPGRPARSAGHRMYFVRGTSGWIRRLADSSGAALRVHPAGATLRTEEGGPVVSLPGAPEERFDRAILATGAQQGLAAWPDAPREVAEVLRAFGSAPCVSTAHSWTGVMPGDVNAWRAFNVMIHDPGRPAPFGITFYGNRHQHDAAHPHFNLFGGAQFFVTIAQQPSASLDLDGPEGRGGAPDPFAIPERHVFAMPGPGYGVQARLRFERPRLDFAAYRAQARLPSVQGVHGVYFAGGWTKGIGLHEEAWLSGVSAARRALDPQFLDEHQWEIPGAYTPRYLRDLLEQQ